MGEFLDRRRTVLLSEKALILPGLLRGLVIVVVPVVVGVVIAVDGRKEEVVVVVACFASDGRRNAKLPMVTTSLRGLRIE